MKQPEQAVDPKVTGVILGLAACVLAVAGVKSRISSSADQSPSEPTQQEIEQLDRIRSQADTISTALNETIGDKAKSVSFTTLNGYVIMPSPTGLNGIPEIERDGINCAKFNNPIILDPGDGKTPKAIGVLSSSSTGGAKIISTNLYPDTPNTRVVIHPDQPYIDVAARVRQTTTLESFTTTTHPNQQVIGPPSTNMVEVTRSEIVAIGDHGESPIVVTDKTYNTFDAPKVSGNAKNAGSELVTCISQYPS